MVETQVLCIAIIPCSTGVKLFYNISFLHFSTVLKNFKKTPLTNVLNLTFIC
jgi:hypothetical protein